MSALPPVLLACAVCFSATDENRQAFLLTTIFLSLLPLSAIVGGGWWIAKRLLAADPDLFTERPDPTETVGPHPVP